ncbi:MAG: hypothetical protein AB7W59_01800 [Acidimicrobiia bacterium]
MDTVSEPGAAVDPAAPGGGRPHGVYATYRSGCRCDECRRANADHCRDNSRAYYKRNYAKRTFVAGRWIAPLPEEKHGKPTTYSLFGCRCLSCTRANSEYRAAWRARRSAS